MKSYLLLKAVVGVIIIGIHLAVLYFVIKAAIRNGIQEAREDIKEDKKNGFE